MINNIFYFFTTSFINQIRNINIMQFKVYSFVVIFNLTITKMSTVFYNTTNLMKKLTLKDN